MPLMCLVPHCSNGSRYSRSLNKIHSMFNIPKDATLKRKWEEAIPGDLKLKYGQVVCAKHFLKNQVITEFELKDKFGNILGKKAYKRPRLKENAVPSIFEMPISIVAQHQEDNFTKARNATDVNILLNNDFDADLLKIIRKKYSEESVVDINSLTNESNSSNLSPIVNYNIHSNSNLKNCRGIPQQSKEQNNLLQVCYKSIICINNKEIEIPKSWSIIQKNLKGQLTLIFTHSVSVIVNESENKDMVKKYITYNCSNGNARYFAHGKEVVGARSKVHLLPQLHSTELLVATLLKFEKMKMCEGLKKECISHMIAGEYYMDKFHTWRTKNCTLLITKFKRCEFCIELMRKFDEKGIQLSRVPRGSKLEENAVTLNEDFKNKVDTIFETYEKMPVTSTEDEYIQEIDSLEFSNNQETLIKEINVKKQTCPNDKFEESRKTSHSSVPTTFKFVFEMKKCRN